MVAGKALTVPFSRAPEAVKELPPLGSATREGSLLGPAFNAKLEYARWRWTTQAALPTGKVWGGFWDWLDMPATLS